MKREELIKRIEKKLPARTDRFIRAQIKALFEAQNNNPRKHWFYWLAMPAVACSFFLLFNFYAVQAPGVKSSQLVLAAATETFERRQTLMDGSIHHQKFTISEGKDKAAFIAATTDLSLEQAQTVPLRTDQVEYWHHSNTRKADIDSNLSAVDQGWYMVLENEDHIHIFHDPESLNKDRNRSPERIVFDNVHNLGSHYDQYKAFHPIGPEEWPAELQYIESQNSLHRFRELLNNKQIDWLINDAGEVVAQEIFVYHENKPYQMAVIDFIGETFLAPDKFTEVFNPEENEFKQTDVFPLSEK